MDVLARLVAGRLDRLHDEAERVVGRSEVRSEAALVADIGVVAGVLQLLLQRLEDLGAHADRLGYSSAATGMIMNSWMSIGLSAWAPPLMMFIIGTGSMLAKAPPT